MSPDIGNNSMPDLTAVTLARMEGKLDVALQKTAEHDVRLDRSDGRMEAIATRVTVLEARRAQNAPWMTNLLAIAAIVAAVLVGALK